jgi:hypothetical protein
VSKLHVELDGIYGQGLAGLVLKDGEPQADVIRLAVALDPNRGIQVVEMVRVLTFAGRVYQAEETGIITKLTITAEYQEA